MLKRYNFEKQISSGKFAKVYKAYDTQTQKHVAIKCMKKERVHHSNGDVDIKKENFPFPNCLNLYLN